MRSALRKAVPPYRADPRLKNSTLACPDCYYPLTREQGIHCTVCGSSWSEVGGVPRFASSDCDWGEIPEAEMIQVNELAQKIGWRKAIDETVKGPYPQVHDDMTDKARADFRFVLPLQPRSKVLDVGAGFGTISFGLQPHCGWVTAVEPIAERAKFIEIRRSQERLQNMEVAIADGLDLPFSPETFDFIVVNGCLGRVGLADPTMNPRVLQRKFLARLHRLLRPGGAVYIGIENRFGYDRFLGAQDHSGLKYTSLMPRWMADLACRYFLKRPDRVSRARGDYRTYTYGKRGYRKLLSEAGFSEVETFMPRPGYNKPIDLISLDHPDPLRFYLNHAVSPASKGGKLKKQIALWGTSIGLTGFFSPHFSLVAWKEGRYD